MQSKHTKDRMGQEKHFGLPFDAKTRIHWPINRQWSQFICLNDMQFLSLDGNLEATIRFLLTVWYWVLDKLSLALKMTKNKFFYIIFGAVFKVCWTTIFVNPYKYIIFSDKQHGSLPLSHKHYTRNV